MMRTSVIAGDIGKERDLRLKGKFIIRKLLFASAYNVMNLRIIFEEKES
jgi:hypothetical protein